MPLFRNSNSYTRSGFSMGGGSTADRLAELGALPKHTEALNEGYGAEAAASKAASRMYEAEADQIDIMTAAMRSENEHKESRREINDRFDTLDRATRVSQKLTGGTRKTKFESDIWDELEELVKKKDKA